MKLCLVPGALCAKQNPEELSHGSGWNSALLGKAPSSCFAAQAVDIPSEEQRRSLTAAGEERTFVHLLAVAWSGLGSLGSPAASQLFVGRL